MVITNVDAIREEFPIFRHRAYLDNACYAPGFARGTKAVEAYCHLHEMIPCTSFHQTLAELKPVANCRSEVAKLLNAEEEEIAFVPSTGMGNNKFAGAIGLKPGDNIVIDDLEFPSAVLAYTSYQRKGVEIRTVKHKEGRLYIEDFAKLVDNKTRVIAVSTVQWSSGFKIDLKRLVDLANSVGAYVAVDGCQSLGAIKLDVKETGVHFVTTQGHKWLFAPMGSGFMYMRKELVDKFDPDYVESCNLFKDPARQPYHHQFDLSLERDYAIKFVDTAAKFQSASNIMGIWALNESVKCINSYGIENIEERIQYLVDYLRAGLKTVPGLTLKSPEEREYRGGIVIATYGDIEKDLATMDTLSDLGVAVSCRFQACMGGLRMSPHFYNNEEDIDKLINALKGRIKPLYFH